MSDSVIIPLTIVYYSISLYRSIGYIGPVIVYSYFIGSVIVNRLLAGPLVRLVFLKVIPALHCYTTDRYSLHPSTGEARGRLPLPPHAQPHIRRVNRLLQVSPLISTGSFISAH